MDPLAGMVRTILTSAAGSLTIQTYTCNGNAFPVNMHSTSLISMVTAPACMVASILQEKNRKQSHILSAVV